jgi:hypothetical protein
MRRNVDLPEVTWDSLSVLADELNYASRQALLEAVICTFVGQYPWATLKAAGRTARRLEMKKAEMEYVETSSLPKLSESEIRDLAGDDLYESLTTPTASDVPHETPELPEL